MPRAILEDCCSEIQLCVQPDLRDVVRVNPVLSAAGRLTRRLESTGRRSMRSDYYVYFHRDAQGRVFYIGKGTGRRAWSEVRHSAWRKYVSDRLLGVCSVEIHEQGLTEEEAEDLEGQLIAAYGTQLINWINPGRAFDYKALEEFHRRRDANRLRVEAARSEEKGNPEIAIAEYRAALEEMRGYEALTLERGLVAEMGCGPTWGDPSILDRLTLCLVKEGRYREAILEVDRYFAEFPSARSQSVGKRIQARLDKHRVRGG